MLRKRVKTILACLLLLSLALALLPLRAQAVTQEEIDELRAIRDQVTAEREAADAAVRELEEQQADVMERKRAMDERNAFILEQIRLNSEEIALYDQMIADKAQEVEAAKKLEDEQLARYRVRVRAMEENGGYNILALLLHTNNLGELLTMIDDINEIMESDRALEDAYIAARENTEAIKAEYEEFKAELELKQADLEKSQDELWAEIEKATQLILDLKADIESGKAEAHEILLREIEADEALSEKMAEMERERQAELERQRQAELERQRQQQANNPAPAPAPSNSSAVGTGSLIWPVPSCTYLTSRFGPRVHPILGTTRNHNGIDIAAGYGASILAADGGTVTQAGDAGNGYGIYVIINHGNGYATLYGHMSSTTVSEGQTVSQGDLIGYVGSTGMSTGPHCHYEVWYGGSRVDPEQFYSGLSYSPDAGV